MTPACTQTPFSQLQVCTHLKRGLVLDAGAPPLAKAASASTSASGPAPLCAACHCPNAARPLRRPSGRPACCSVLCCWHTEASCSATREAGPHSPARHKEAQRDKNFPQAFKSRRYESGYCCLLWGQSRAGLMGTILYNKGGPLHFLSVVWCEPVTEYRTAGVGQKDSWDNQSNNQCQNNARYLASRLIIIFSRTPPSPAAWRLDSNSPKEATLAAEEDEGPSPACIAKQDSGLLQWLGLQHNYYILYVVRLMAQAWPAQPAATKGKVSFLRYWLMRFLRVSAWSMPKEERGRVQ